jgi:hypothetical protein
MKRAFQRRLLQAGIATTTSGLMLAAFVGLSAAAPGNGHGASGEAHGNSGASHGQSGEVHGNSSQATGGQAGAATGNGRPADAGDGHGRGQNSANDADNSRPGWGCGDPNHVHTGPAGDDGGFDPCTFRIEHRTLTLVSGTTTQTITTTETATGTQTATETLTATDTTTSST